MRRIPIRFGNLSAVLQLLGSLYRSPAEAIKEHISNAIDEHLKAEEKGENLEVCQVRFYLEKDKITIVYPYGMGRKEFEKVLQSVAESLKKKLDVAQIGRLGIGMFSFFQIGKKCVFFSKKSKNEETIKVTIREGSDEAEFESPKKRERLSEQGIKIVISELKFDPTRARGPLSPQKLEKVFAELYQSYLSNGSLEIEIYQKGKCFKVKPSKIELPRVGEFCQNWPVSGDENRKISFELYFDPSGKGKVGIRHQGVVVVDDFKNLSAYGLEETVYGSGDLTGFIDADFLEPLPARSGFEANKDWEDFLNELMNLLATIEGEVEEIKLEYMERKLTEIQKKAIETAKEILGEKEFVDLELLEGLGKRDSGPAIPAHGFDFMPSSLRVAPGKEGRVYLKALVPEKVPDNAVVKFKIDNPEIAIKPKWKKLKKSDSDTYGVVTIPLSVKGEKKTFVSAVIIATVKIGDKEELSARASVMISEKGESREKRRKGINYEERAFEDGPSLHSRYASGVIQINTLNPDYKEAMGGSEEEKLNYATLMIGKETFAYNDKSGTANYLLEKLLTFHFKLMRVVAGTRSRASSKK